jgi:hypothetical protein
VATDHHRGGGEKTALTSDLRVQEFAATVSGGRIDLAWKAPDFDGATRQLVGFELFRDDVSTHPPSRLGVGTMPNNIVVARGLEILPHSEYGVQAIWRLFAGWPYADIQFGPPRLTKDLAGPEIVVPPEERIHSLASLQRQGLITSEELEQAVEKFLGRAQPGPEAQPTRRAAISGAPSRGATSANRRRLASTYITIAAVLVLGLVAAEQLASRLLFTQPPASNAAASPSPGQSPTPTVGLVDVSSILIKPTDLRTGYVVGSSATTPLCPRCEPAGSSLAIVFQNAKLKRTILSGASVAASTAGSKSVAAALMAFRAAPRTWVPVSLGDEGYTTSLSTQGQSQISYFVVWRTGVVTNQIMLVVPAGSLKLQDAIDLAKIQQARAATALG